MILGVIPARGGSKGVPRKNIRNICGKPLIAWSIEAAKKASLLDDFVVSTEDAEIAEVAAKFGAKVLPRPPKLATDEATTISVLQHVVKEMNPDVVVVLQPTSPIRDNDLIDVCISRFLKEEPDNLATGYFCKIREYGTYDNMRRQDIDGFFYDDGNVYVLKKDLIQKGDWTSSNMVRLPISKEQNFEIDDDIDFFVIEKLLERHRARDFFSEYTRIKLIVTDVDGVLTDAGMYYSNNGDELKKFNTRDGKGVELARNAGIKTALITQEHTTLVENRAKKLRFDYVFQGVNDKLRVLREIASIEHLSMDQIAYIGDDLNDLQVLRSVKFSFSPADACDEVKAVSSYITHAKGGEGVFREVIGIILKNSKE